MGHLAFGNLAKIRGIISYSISPYEQRAMAGVIKQGVPNTIRRFKENVFVVGIPFVAGYILYIQTHQANKKYNRKDPEKYECDV